MQITRSQQNNRLKGRLSGTASDMCHMYNSIRKCQEMERDGNPLSCSSLRWDRLVPLPFALRQRSSLSGSWFSSWYRSSMLWHMRVTFFSMAFNSLRLSFMALAKKLALTLSSKAFMIRFDHSSMT
ncbi:hypothetical protein MAR_018696 [Mya arenaria]|uniref:Uncharacterized protein n=1 Tax=Mya arenaria TaxID=6604 RepID=A0ABY7EJA7_MYAAR|nr:hypothetical protein MAR_018696 [Mya arenaria]